MKDGVSLIYGPRGALDMVLFKLIKAILNGYGIDVNNHGDMGRDFMYTMTS